MPTLFSSIHRRRDILQNVANPWHGIWILSASLRFCRHVFDNDIDFITFLWNTVSRQVILICKCLSGHTNCTNAGNASVFMPVWYMSCKAKNHTSPEEPYFATFYNYDFQYSGVKFIHFFEGVCKKRIGIHLQKKKEICFCRKWRNYRRFKISGEIWSPGEIWFFTLCLNLTPWPSLGNCYL